MIDRTSAVIGPMSPINILDLPQRYGPAWRSGRSNSPACRCTLDARKRNTRFAEMKNDPSISFSNVLSLLCLTDEKLWKMRYESIVRYSIVAYSHIQFAFVSAVSVRYIRLIYVFLHHELINSKYAFLTVLKSAFSSGSPSSTFLSHTFSLRSIVEAAWGRSGSANDCLKEWSDSHTFPFSLTSLDDERALRNESARRQFRLRDRIY